MDITFSPNILQPTSHVVQYHLLLIAASRSPSHLSQMGRSVSWRSTPGRPTAVFPAVIKTLGGTTTTGGQRRPSTREILISSSHPIVLIILFELLRNNSLLIQLFVHRYFQTLLNVFTSCFFRICNIFFQWLCLFNPNLKRKSEARWQVYSLASDLICFYQFKIRQD